jgi:ubiquinol-cytochrome c reductase cytochrome c1 subunit
MKMLRFAVLALTLVSAPAFASSNEIHIPKQQWSFDGPFGTFDKASLQRGFLVYKQVCAACHGMKHLAYRNLAAIGLNEMQVKAVAADVTVMDGPNDDGEMFERPGQPSDRFKSPYANEKAARASNNGAYPPDLSLIIKARGDGANYVYSLLTGFTEPPEGVVLGTGMYYNKYFAGHQIAMAPPLTGEGQVQYADETVSSTEQMAHDVVSFLAWAAEPEMEARKRMGVKVMLFLGIFAAIMYAVKRKVWSKLED